MKRILYIFILIFFVLSLTSCSEAKKFSCPGLSVTLDKNFKKESVDGYQLYASNDEVFFAAFKDEKDDVDKTEYNFIEMTLQEYANLFGINNEIEIPELTEKDGLYYFEYTKKVESTLLWYRTFIFKTANAFWTCQFGCLTKDRAEYDYRIIDWAKTIKL